MTGLPDISVVIPAFQAERHLAESITSVLAQDLAPVEILVVDDGSTDATAEVAEAFGERVRTVRMPENRGEAAARNRGVAESTAATIAMHDADDRMVPNRLRLQVEHLVAGGASMGCVVGEQRVFTEDGGPLPGWALDAEGEPIRFTNSPVLAWRTTYDRVGPYDEGFVTGCDSDWLLRVRAAGLEVGLLAEVLIERRIHEANLSATEHAPERLEYARSLRKILDSRRAAE